MPFGLPSVYTGCGRGEPVKKQAALTLGMALLLLVILVVASHQSVLKLEDYSWTLTTAQDQNGNVIACSSEDSAQYPNAEKLSLFCEAQDGMITLSSQAITAKGTYRQTQQNPEGRLYEMEIKDLGWGYAVCSYTEFHSGEQLPTLVMSFPKEYTLTFTGTRK